MDDRACRKCARLANLWRRAWGLLPGDAWMGQHPKVMLKLRKVGSQNPNVRALLYQYRLGQDSPLARPLVKDVDVRRSV